MQQLWHVLVTGVGLLSLLAGVLVLTQTDWAVNPSMPDPPDDQPPGGSQ